MDADAHGIERVINCLLSNAKKYGRDKPIQIVVGLDQGHSKVYFSIIDQGVGMREADIDRIFKPFERAIPMKNISGFGLGLYIAKYIIAGHGGVLKVKSELNQGSTFTFELPLN